VRLSMTRLSGFLQYGQNTRSPPAPTTEPVPANTTCGWTTPL